MKIKIIKINKGQNNSKIIKDLWKLFRVIIHYLKINHLHLQNLKD